MGMYWHVEHTQPQYNSPEEYDVHNGGSRGKHPKTYNFKTPPGQKITPTTVPLVVHLPSTLTHFALPNHHAKDPTTGLSMHRPVTLRI
jgi:hypothetical protein